MDDRRPGAEIRLIDPFQGGHITRRHGQGFADGGIAWIQIEMNRSWYLLDPWYDRAAQQVDPERLRDLQRRFKTALEALPILR